MEMDTWIVTDSTPLAERVQRSLQQVKIGAKVRSLHRPSDIDELLDRADLVFIAVETLREQDIEFIGWFRSKLPSAAKLVTVSAASDYGIVLKAIRAGASDFVIADERLDSEMAGLISRIGAKCDSRHSIGKVVTTIPCHSGADCNVFAVNLAAAFAKRLQTCGLLDFHFRGGDLAMLLKLDPKHTVLDLLNKRSSIDESMFLQATCSHTSGIKLLAGPVGFTNLSAINFPSCQQLIELAQRAWPVSIVNVEDLQHAEQIRALAVSNAIVLTTRLDILSLHRAQRYVDFLLSSHVARELIHVVAMGTGQPGELPASSLKRIQHFSSVHCIPDDPLTTIASVNLGTPFVLEQPGAEISIAVDKVAVALSQGLINDSERESNRFSAVKAAAVVALSSLPFYRNSAF